MLVKAFFKHNWIGIFGLVVGALGVLLSIFFYVSSRVAPRPTLLFDPVRALIFDTNHCSEGALKVLDLYVVNKNETNLPLN